MLSIRRLPTNETRNVSNKIIYLTFYISFFVVKISLPSKGSTDLLWFVFLADMKLVNIYWHISELNGERLQGIE